MSIIVKLADRISSKLFPSLTIKDSDPENGAIVYHDTGSISLNLSNKKVQRRITQQLEALSQIKIKKSNHT